MVGSGGGTTHDTREAWREEANFLQSKCVMEDNGLPPLSALPPHHSSYACYVIHKNLGRKESWG